MLRHRFNRRRINEETKSLPYKDFEKEYKRVRQLIFELLDAIDNASDELKEFLEDEGIEFDVYQSIGQLDSDFADLLNKYDD